MKLILLEISSYVNLVLVWWLFRRFLHRDLKRDIFIGTVIGFFLEFSTTPVSNYHYQITIYKDLPLIIPFWWGLMFAITVFVSERIYTRLFRRKSINSQDPHFLWLDGLCGVFIGFPLESMGHALGVWDYNVVALNWTLGIVPFFGMPWEAPLAYALIMLVSCSILRFWRRDSRSPHFARYA